MLNRLFVLSLIVHLVHLPVMAEQSRGSGIRESFSRAASESAGNPSVASNSEVGGTGWVPPSAASERSKVDAVAAGSYMMRDELSDLPRGSEYISGFYKGAVLMEVNLWGAVSKAGVHHVPLEMDLLTFLSLAGGPSEAAKLDEVTITRVGRSGAETIEVDLEDLLENPTLARPKLQPHDTILVPMKKPLFDQNLLLTLGVISSTLGIVVSAILVGDRL